MAKDMTLAIIGLGAVALFAFRKDLSKITGGVGTAVGGTGKAISDIAGTTSKSIKRVVSPLKIVESSTDVATQFLKEKRQTIDVVQDVKREKSLKRATGDLNRQSIQESQKTARVQIRQQAATGVTRTAVAAAQNIKDVFVSKFRPTPLQITERRTKLKATVSKVVSKAKSLKNRLFGDKIFGRG